MNNSQERIIVSTGDIPYQYEIIEPVYYQVSNKMSLFGESQYIRLEKKYKQLLQQLHTQNRTTSIAGGQALSNVLMAFMGEFPQHTTQFERAFYMAVEELKLAVKSIGGNGLIYLRQDIDLDTTGFQFFYLQMYGTAVKITGPK